MKTPSPLQKEPEKSQNPQALQASQEDLPIDSGFCSATEDQTNQAFEPFPETPLGTTLNLGAVYQKHHSKSPKNNQKTRVFRGSDLDEEGELKPESQRKNKPTRAAILGAMKSDLGKNGLLISDAILEEVFEDSGLGVIAAP